MNTDLKIIINYLRCITFIVSFIAGFIVVMACCLYAQEPTLTRYDTLSAWQVEYIEDTGLELRKLKYWEKSEGLVRDVKMYSYLNEDGTIYHVGHQWEIAFKPEYLNIIPALCDTFYLVFFKTVSGRVANKKEGKTIK